MKENFVICIETLHAGDVGDQQNVSAYCAMHAFGRLGPKFPVVLVGFFAFSQ